MIRACLTCGSEFSYSPSQKRKYCGVGCVPVNLGNKVRWKNKIPVQIVCEECGADFSVRPSKGRRAKFCSFMCKQIAGGRKGGTANAEKIRGTGKSYPKIKGRHAHRVIAERMLGRPLKPGEIVHHKNGNKLDYSEDNLTVLPSQGEHVREHIKDMLKQRKEVHGY